MDAAGVSIISAWARRRFKARLIVLIDARHRHQEERRGVLSFLDKAAFVLPTRFVLTKTDKTRRPAFCPAA